MSSNIDVGDSVKIRATSFIHSKLKSGALGTIVYKSKSSENLLVLFDIDNMIKDATTTYRRGSATARLAYQGITNTARVNDHIVNMIDSYYAEKLIKSPHRRPDDDEDSCRYVNVAWVNLHDLRGVSSEEEQWF